MSRRDSNNYTTFTVISLDTLVESRGSVKYKPLLGRSDTSPFFFVFFIA